MAGITAIAATAGAVASGVGTGMSFAQASKQKQKASEANAAANKAMAEARKRLEVNYAEQLSIQKEPYRLERERSRAAGAQLTEAARESERGAAAAAGRIYGMEQDAQADIGVRMGQELIDRERAIIEEDMRLADIGAQMSLDEVKGAQLAAREADERAALAKAQGVQGVVDFVGAAGQIPKLYSEKDLVAATPTTLDPYPDRSRKSGATDVVSDATDVVADVDIFNRDLRFQNYNPRLTLDLENPYQNPFGITNRYLRRSR
tara:strand:+ start:9204 stop:9989 length:786 start_codon:yes stop_codon:yes gene_type:complete